MTGEIKKKYEVDIDEVVQNMLEAVTDSWAYCRDCDPIRVLDLDLETIEEITDRAILKLVKTVRPNGVNWVD